MEVAKEFAEAGFRILASKHTCRMLNEAGIQAESVNKLQEGRPNMLDLITNGEIDLIINSPVEKERKMDDSYLRKAAVKKKVPYVTTMAAAKATISGIRFVKEHGSSGVESLQEYHSEITQ